MRKNKTAQRIMQWFYCPSLFKDTAEYCRTCAECQKTSKRKGRPAPLIPLPVMEETFQRIAMDIVGPLPRSRSVKKYVLVVCDYATQISQSNASSLHRCGAYCGGAGETVLKSRSAEGDTDRPGSNFNSQLLVEVYRLLKVKPIRTSPYHPQTDGLVERFNQTLKTMLRKCAKKEGKDWDNICRTFYLVTGRCPRCQRDSPHSSCYTGDKYEARWTFCVSRGSQVVEATRVWCHMC